MKDVLVLGAGEVGASAAHYAARKAGGVTVADLDGERAGAAASAAGKNVRPLQLDVTDQPGLEEAMRAHRVVLNTVGPFFRFAKPVFDAAIATGTDYIDVADDWEPVLDLAALDDEARKAGIRAIVGMGASPGLANLLARLAMEDRPDATSLVTTWRADDVGEGYSAAKEHWLHQCTGTIRVLRGGRLIDEPPLQDLEIEYPLIGQIALATVGHPEAVTLPRRYPHLDTCLNAMAVPPRLLELLRNVREENPQDMHAAASGFTERYHAMGEDDLSVVGKLPGMFAAAIARDGSSVVTLLDYPEGLGPVTAAPMVTALVLLEAGDGPAAGVWMPEDAFAPAPFLAAFSELFGGEDPLWRLERT